MGRRYNIAVIAQESYLLEDILPRLSGRILLLGFSKPGNGALTLLLRHPERFAAAAAWDAPFLLDTPGKYGAVEIFGTAENFAGYRIPALLEKRAAELRGKPARMSGWRRWTSRTPATTAKNGLIAGAADGWNRRWPRSTA